MIYFPHTDLTVDTNPVSNYVLIYERIQWHAESPFYVGLPAYLYGNSDHLETLAEPYGIYKNFADFVSQRARPMSQPVQE